GADRVQLCPAASPKHSDEADRGIRSIAETRHHTNPAPKKSHSLLSRESINDAIKMKCFSSSKHAREHAREHARKDARKDARNDAVRSMHEGSIGWHALAKIRDRKFWKGSASLQL